jgi:hypothetical protein
MSPQHGRETLDPEPMKIFGLADRRFKAILGEFGRNVEMVRASVVTGMRYLEVTSSGASRT